jgi:predicted aspartyl protease
MIQTLQKISAILCLFLFFSIMLPPTLHCEFYEYTDENGVKCFTDDSGRIPEKRSKKVRVHKERLDGLSAEEKEAQLKAEQEDLSHIRMKQEENGKLSDEKKKKEEEELAEIEKKKMLETLKTPVVIENNQVLVPVTLTNSDKTVTAIMLLDTGANVTNITDSLAQQLNITSSKQSAARVANGSVVRTSQAIIKSMSVGPKSVKSPLITVMKQNGPKLRFQGLLGQDFLKNFEYTIDYKTNHIIWKQ